MQRKVDGANSTGPVGALGLAGGRTSVIRLSPRALKRLACSCPEGSGEFQRGHDCSILQRVQPEGGCTCAAAQTGREHQGQTHQRLLGNSAAKPAVALSCLCSALKSAKVRHTDCLVLCCMRIEGLSISARKFTEGARRTTCPGASPSERQYETASNAVYPRQDRKIWSALSLP